MLLLEFVHYLLHTEQILYSTVYHHFCYKDTLDITYEYVQSCNPVPGITLPLSKLGILNELVVQQLF